MKNNYQTSTTGVGTTGRTTAKKAEYDAGRAVEEAASPQELQTRPDPAVWSAIEYACHVRDVLLVQRDRAVLALVEESPSFARMYRDERVALCGYARQAMGDVLAHLAMAAELCAMVFEGLDEAGWSRPLVYNWPEAAELDLAWLGRHTLHEVEHHLQDITQVLSQVTAG